MKSKELKDRYLDFFKERGHVIIKGTSLIPENDPSALFTSAGMHPLVPFLLGQPHPKGRRVANCQRCLRTADIEEVGDDTHFTFFEMLGNWSFGDYFKKEAIEWSYEFVTTVLNFPHDRLAVSCFKGDNDALMDDDSANIWRKLGIAEDRIAFLPKKDNWWGPIGQTGPCGPDTEIFFWNSDEPVPTLFNPDDERWVEIWNNVFMEYDKKPDGLYTPLKQKNVDTGLGLERVLMILQNKTNIYEIDSVVPIYYWVRELSGFAKDQVLPEDKEKSVRIITDHIRSAVFILGDEFGVPPSNLDQGYILRRFLRRSIRHMRLLGIDINQKSITAEIANVIVNRYKDDYSILENKLKFILTEIKKEEEKFKKTLDKGLKEFEKITNKNVIDGKTTFFMFQTYGLPLEVICEIGNERKIKVDKDGFYEEYKKHQELSRKGAEKKFKGGLADDSRETTAYHTATHLLNAALRKVLGPEIKQKGSNITRERLRFDFSFHRKLTDLEKKEVEEIVNKQIKKGIPITSEVMPLEQALKTGAAAEFEDRYPDEVFVYSIGDFSKEICFGPHVDNTKELGVFKITKEQNIGSGLRRIKAVLQ